MGILVRGYAWAESWGQPRGQAGRTTGDPTSCLRVATCEGVREGEQLPSHALLVLLCLVSRKVIPVLTLTDRERTTARTTPPYTCHTALAVHCSDQSVPDEPQGGGPPLRSRGGHPHTWLPSLLLVTQLRQASGSNEVLESGLDFSWKHEPQENREQTRTAQAGKGGARQTRLCVNT